MADMKI